MMADKAETDWNEPEMAAYLRDHILDCSSNLITAAWISGIGAILLGLTTYAPNTIERNHLGMKDLLPDGIDEKDLSSTTVDVCGAVQTKLEEGDFDKIRTRISRPYPNLWSWPRPQTAKVNDWDAEGVDEEGNAPVKGKRKAPVRLGVRDLVNWNAEHPENPEKLN